MLVTHDEGAVTALSPERILLLPDGVEDLWGPDYLDLIAGVWGAPDAARGTT